MDINLRVKNIIAKVLKSTIAEIKDELSLRESLDVDSTEMVELLLAFEKEFGLQLSPKAITKNTSVNEIVHSIVSVAV
jgi:acyl carrier protein